METEIKTNLEKIAKEKNLSVIIKKNVTVQGGVDVTGKMIKKLNCSKRRLRYMEMTLKEISQVINGELIGDENLIISVTNINDAEATAITFAVEPHLEAAKNSKAGAIIVERNVTDFKQNIIKVDNPRVAFMKLLVLFAPTVTIKKEVHPTAILGKC